MRVLQIWRDGRRFKSKVETPLLDGYQGNLQTLAIMADMVRRDRTQIDLRNFVEREIIGDKNGLQPKAQTKKLFEFCQKEIVYERDPVQVERVADLWSCLYALNPDHPEGDCGIKSVALATMLSLLGYKPVFAVVKQGENATNFNHVFVEVFLNDKWVALDPTPEDVPIGWECEALKKYRYTIFQ